MRSPDVATEALAARAKALADARRLALHAAVGRTFQLILPLQWLGSCVLCWLQSAAGGSVALSSRGLNPWVGVALSTLVNGATWVVIRSGTDRAAARYIIGASQVVFYILLLAIGAGRFDTSLYLFVSLAFLAFYRDARLLAAIAGAGLVAQFGSGALLGTFPDNVTSEELRRFATFGPWVLMEYCVLALICHRGNLLFRNIGWEQAQAEIGREASHRQVLERTRQLETANEQYRALLESTSAVPWEMDDGTGACRYIGAQVERQWGWAAERFQEAGFLFGRVHTDDRPAFAQALEEAVASHDVAVECRLQLGAGGFAHVRSFLRHAPDEKGRIVRGISIDITNQKKLETELYQAQKLESVGRLAAGVAHEINTPVQFVNDNCYFLRDAVSQLGEVLRTYQEVFVATNSGQLDAEAARERIEAAEQAVDLAFLSENMPTAVERSLEGLERVATIVRSMKEFSHPNSASMSSADLNAAILSTLTVARNEYKYVADVKTQLADIPLVVCNVGEFNQTFLNLLVNAAHAIEDTVKGTDRRGIITITTEQDGDTVAISVQDTGGGIPEAIQGNIFDPFFTTKEVGKGTGQGLAIARTVIVDKHRGSLTFESVPGVGTTFLIRLPLDPNPVEAVAA
jgi:PAS domain S-box-containing protein